MREGQARQCEVLHILMRDTIEGKQSLSERTAVLPVIRMNQIFNIPIGLGVQQQSISVFWSRDGAMAQFTFAGADSLGNASDVSQRLFVSDCAARVMQIRKHDQSRARSYL